MQAFLNLAKPEQFARYNVSGSWPDGVPAPWQLNPGRTALRYNIPLARSDIYFYLTRYVPPLPLLVAPTSSS